MNLRYADYKHTDYAKVSVGMYAFATGLFNPKVLSPRLKLIVVLK